MGLTQVTIYVDGSSLGNPGDSGWGVVLQRNGVTEEFSGFIPNATNNYAELTAVIEALKGLKEPCEVLIYSDSEMTVNCATGEYTRRKNLDLWGEYDRVSAPHLVNIQWVEGHTGIPGNERAHKLADQAARRGMA